MYAIALETITFNGGISFNQEGFNQNVTIEKGKVYSIIGKKYLTSGPIVSYYIIVEDITVQISSNGRARYFKIIETIKVWDKTKKLICGQKQNVI